MSGTRRGGNELLPSPGCVSSSAVTGHWLQFTRETGRRLSRSSRISARFSARPAIGSQQMRQRVPAFSSASRCRAHALGERVGVRVVVDHHQQPARSAEEPQQFAHVLRHGLLLRKIRSHAA